MLLKLLPYSFLSLFKQHRIKGINYRTTSFFSILKISHNIFSLFTAAISLNAINSRNNIIVNLFMWRFEGSKAWSLPKYFCTLATLSPFTETAVVVIGKFFIYFIGKDTFVSICFKGVTCRNG